MSPGSIPTVRLITFTAAAGATIGLLTTAIRYGETSNVFDSVNISNADQLPQNATVKIRVITDTVQAVETDERSWTAADYKYDQVAFAWTGATATVDKSGLSESQLASQVTAPVNWSFS